jgi:hypothetical protein
MLWRTVRVACALCAVAAVAAPACGGSSSSPGAEAGGNGGASAGGSAGSVGHAGTVGSAGAAPTSLKCGTATCKAVTIPVPGSPFTIPPCCADDATNQCGLDSSVLAAFGPTFPVACQPLHQPGDLNDTSCPPSMKSAVSGSALMIQFDGCCRADHTCGYNLETLASVVPLGLGCVDSAPFVDGGLPQSCGGEAGAGGTSEGGASSAAGSSEGGAAGN